MLRAEVIFDTSHDLNILSQEEFFTELLFKKR